MLYCGQFVPGITMKILPKEADPTAMPTRWELIRDVGVLQVKLVIDGLRDFLLVPVSLAAGILSFLKAGDRPGTEFYDLLRYARRSERAINLFGAAARVHGNAENDAPVTDIDDVVAQVESFVVDEYKNGGITAQAKQRLDGVLRAVDEARRRRSGRRSP